MAKEVVIPWELKYKFALGGWASILKGFFYAIRKKYSATAALETYEIVARMDDRVKNMTKTILNVFKLDGNDIETISKWFDIWHALTGMESTTLELSNTLVRARITKCPFKMEAIDLSDWDLKFFTGLVTKTINPKATVEQPKNMCAGDPYCEFVIKIE